MGEVHRWFLNVVLSLDICDNPHLLIIIHNNFTLLNKLFFLNDK